MPKPRVDAFLDALTEVGGPGDVASLDQLWDMTASFFAQNGFDKLICLDARPAPELGVLTMLTTLQREWIIRYQDCGYAQIDPLFGICCASSTPVRTSIAYADSHKK